MIAEEWSSQNPQDDMANRRGRIPNLRLLASHQSAVADALRLRRWGLALLTGEENRPPPKASDNGYRLFLEAERCGVRLLHVLTEKGLAGSLPTYFQEKLSGRVVTEQRRIQSARDQLVEVGEIVRERGYRVAVLKGGTVASTLAAVDLVDIDLLVEAAHARDFTAELDRRGYRPMGHSSSRHLIERSRVKSVPIEVHTSIHNDIPTSRNLWASVTPLRAVQGLHRLGRADHLWHLLLHAVVDHPERRGNIRDLLLIGGGVSDCTVDELGAVRRQVATHPSRRVLEETLSMAQAVDTKNLLGDPLEYASAVRYSVRVLLCPLPIPRVLEGYVYRWAVALLFGPAERRNMWKEVFNVSIDPSSHRKVAWLEQRAPRMGRCFRVAGRLARTVLALKGAAPTALLAGRIARRATDELSA